MAPRRDVRRGIPVQIRKSAAQRCTMALEGCIEGEVGAQGPPRAVAHSTIGHILAVTPFP
jgi:hypothetical protein